MILTERSPEIGIVRDMVYHFHGLMLASTLEKMVGEIAAHDFWDNHQKAQDALDAQCEPDAGVVLHLAKSAFGERYHRVLGRSLEPK